jgi:hypothetical protein
MIKNMSPDEARIMRLFAVRAMFPMIDVRLHRKDQEGYEYLRRSFSSIGNQAGCSVPDLTPNYLDNLSRLGLIESPGAHTSLSPSIATPNTYEPLEQADEIKLIKQEAEALGARVECGRTFVRVTDLGKQFCQACVVEKSAAAKD